MKAGSTITLTSIVRRNPEMIANQMDGEIVMMSLDNGEYYGLDEIGSRIWELLELPVQVDLLVEKLMEEFEVNKEQCATDTIEFLKEMMDKKLLMINETAHP